MKKAIVSIILVLVSLSLVSAISINEVELNPGGNDSGNEWVELYSEDEFNLEGYYLENSAGNIHNLNGSFSGYLVIRFDSEWLNNIDEKVYLKESDIVIDETPILGDSEDNFLAWSDCSIGWQFVPASAEANQIHVLEAVEEVAEEEYVAV